jgi:outer membrane protein TolC
MRSILLASLCVSILLATEGKNSDSLLSSLKQEQFDLQYKYNEINSDKLKFDWLNPITGAWSWTKIDKSISSDSETGTFSIALDQPIFKSGGIYFAMKYADANREFLHLSTQLEEQNLIKEAMDLVLNYQKNALQIKRTQLQIDNAIIDIKRKKEQFESGFVDSSDLDQAVLAKNTLEHTLLELQITQESLKRSFEAISDADITTLQLPQFSMMSKEEFVQSSLEVKKQKGEYLSNQWLQKATISDYLPTISINGTYYDKRYEPKMDSTSAYEYDDGYYSYGIKISMPLYDVNRGRNIELKRIETIKSGLKLQDVKRSEQKLYARVYKEVEYLKQKRKIALENYELYEELVASARDLLEAGEKTIFDVQTLENSRDTMQVDAQIYSIDAQLALLDLYAKMQGEI